jgi:hypothetical protein
MTRHLPLSIVLSAVVGVAVPVLTAQSASAQPSFMLAQNAAAAQAMAQFDAAMSAAEHALEAKLPADELLKALQGPEAVHEQKILELRSHPQYQPAFQRMLALRLKLIKLYANIGYLYAKTAAERSNPALMTQPGGAFASMKLATDMLASYARYKGEADPGYREMSTYVANLKTQVDSVGRQFAAAGELTAGVPESSTPIDNGVRTYFRQWWEKLDEVDSLMAKNDQRAQQALAAAQAHQKGWNGWLVKHSEFERVLARQNAFSAKLATAKADGFIAEAMTMATKAHAEKNLNFFTPEAGPAQRLGWARKELDAYIKLNGEADPAVGPLQRRIDAAATQIEQWGKALKAEKLAGRKMPVEAYTGGDKAGLKAQVLAYWKGKYPQDKILGLRFFETNWTRETNWKTNATSIYKSDYSWLPVKVVVQDSGEIAKIYPVFVNKQHQSGNRIVITGDHSGGGYVVDEMLMKNVRF